MSVARVGSRHIPHNRGLENLTHCAPQSTCFLSERDRERGAASLGCCPEIRPGRTRFHIDGQVFLHKIEIQAS